MTTRKIDPTSIKITGEPQDDPDFCRFLVDRPLLAGEARVPSSEVAREHAVSSPLITALFSIDGVREVRVSGPSVWIGKHGSSEWPVIGKIIGAAIRSAIVAEAETGRPMVEEGLGEKLRKLLEKSLPPSELEGPEAQAIQRVLDEKVNPSVADHGGYVSLVDYRGKIAYVKLEGGCQGCGMAGVTLRQGIETTILKEVPGVRGVQDATDHALGENPYFQ